MNTASSRVSAKMTVSEILTESATVERDRRIAEAKEYISRASVHLRGLGPDYERIAWLLEDTIELFDHANLDSDVDYSAGVDYSSGITGDSFGDFSVLTREFVPVARLSAQSDSEDLENTIVVNDITLDDDATKTASPSALKRGKAEK